MRDASAEIHRPVRLTRRGRFVAWLLLTVAIVAAIQVVVALSTTAPNMYGLLLVALIGAAVFVYAFRDSIRTPRWWADEDDAEAFLDELRAAKRADDSTRSWATPGCTPSGVRPRPAVHRI